MANELVYSSDGADNKKSKNKGSKNNSSKYTAGSGPVKLRREKKGRGGKVVTVLSDIPLALDEAKKLMKALQEHLACGGTLKGSTIELRGDVMGKTIVYLESSGIKAHQAGG